VGSRSGASSQFLSAARVHPLGSNPMRWFEITALTKTVVVASVGGESLNGSFRGMAMRLLLWTRR